MQEAVRHLRAEILARLPLTRFSDRAALPPGCDLRPLPEVADSVLLDLAALKAEGLLRAGAWPQSVPPRAVVRSLVIDESADLAVE